MRRGKDHGAVEIQSVTGARTSLSEDVRGRTQRYLISMGIRTACVVGAVFTGGVLRWVLVAAAIGLPYIAVVMANAGRERASAAPPAAVLPTQIAALPPGRTGPTRDATDEPPR
jgi:hypothetical protein